MIAALMPPDMGNVTSHAMTMLRKIDQSTFSRARNRPTNTTDPTLQWVVLIGTPTFDATSTVNAEPISIQNPLQTNIPAAIDSSCMQFKKTFTLATVFL